MGRLGLWLALMVGCGVAMGQDPLKTLPQNYWLTFQNSSVAVVRAHYGPHEKVPVHDHASSSTVFVYLNDSGPMRIDHADADGKEAPVTRPPTFRGSYRVAAALAERHSIENLSETSSDFLRVELKQVSLGLKEPFRGKAPQSLAHAEDVVEFTDPAVEIERVVCEGSAECAVKPSTSPSLLVAFAPLYIDTGVAAKRVTLAVGDVRWMPAGQAAKITPEAEGPAHVLRILLPGTQPTNDLLK